MNNSTTTFNLTSINTTYIDNVKEDTYDYDGAMKFSVCIVLVYGIGVIGILGMYTHRRRRDILEQETNAFVKTYKDCKELMERQHQISSVQNLIKSIHEDQWPLSSRTSQSSLSSLRTPIVRPAKLMLRTDPATFHKLGNRGQNSRSASSLNVSPDSEESTSFISRRQGSLKYKGSFRRANSLRSEKDRCIPETPETEDGSDQVDVEPCRCTIVDIDDNTPNVDTITTRYGNAGSLEHSNNSSHVQPNLNTDAQTRTDEYSFPNTDSKSNKTNLAKGTMTITDEYNI